MSDLRAKFTENAEQFDSLMVEMLDENEALKKACAGAHDLLDFLLSLDAAEGTAEDFALLENLKSLTRGDK